MRHALILILAVWTGPALAERPMSAAEFEAYTKGRTLTFGANGIAYGIERYLPGRQVIWSFLDGECELGTWYEEAGAICFVYEFKDEPQCWAMFDDGNGLRAEFLNEPDSTILFEAAEGEEELICNDFGA